MRFVLFVEGYTEDKAVRDFLARCLKPHFPPLQQVGITPIRFDGWADMYRDIQKQVAFHLNDPQAGNVIAVISLLDLYGPTIYPANKSDAPSRYAWGVDHLQNRVNDERYRHHFAVHETEAWLLSDSSIFPPPVRGDIRKLSISPEKVGIPARELDRLYLSKINRSYRKVTDGKNLFPKLQPEVALNACPYLTALVNDMVQLALAFQNGRF
jgi:hypothetical protein